MLLQMCFSLNMEYTMRQPLKRPFHNNLEKCTVVNASESVRGRLKSEILNFYPEVHRVCDEFLSETLKIVKKLL